ncbi:transposase [Streptomyces sp. NPDC048191]|uniref:IS701 family transposase n=1 Tax=Streptomyces sp. NPDC048191 TaxID=3155484 RepID=UPI0033CBE16A
MHGSQTGLGCPVPFPAHSPTTDVEAQVTELADLLFRSFPRAGHRLKGEQYLRGLLTAPGRKTVRNIARALGDSGAAQRLHHFVCNAPWRWQPVREALAAHLTDAAPPQAWVVRPLVIPKAGEHSVGVHRRFEPETGQVVNGQQAHGLWYARPGMNAPVDWCLNPPARTLPGGRPQPVDLGPGRRPVTALLDRAGRPGGAAPAPVLWDCPAEDATDALRTLAALPLPGVVRLAGGTALDVLGPSGRRALGTPLPAERIAAAPGAPWLCGHDVAPGVRAVTVRVAAPRPRTAAPGRPADGLLLYAQWRADHPGRADFWLTSLVRAPAAELHRLTALAGQTARDTARTGARVGLRDFEGRSYAGWHRHMTLASAAYTALLRAGGRG